MNTRNRAFLLAGLLALVTLATYWPARHFDFVDYDDDSYVFENDSVRGGLTVEGLEVALMDTHTGNWHPLTFVSHMLDCQLFGLNAGGHHLTSVLLHCANAALLLLLLHCLTGALWRSVIVAAIFALHPLRVESVAWIAERKDVLSGFFFMLTLWMYALHVRSQAAPAADAAVKPGGGRFCRWSLLFFLLGLLSKPMLVTVPLILLLLDFWPLRRTESAGLKNADSSIGKPAAGNRLQLVIEKWPFFLLAFIFGVITLFAQWRGLPSQAGIGSRLADTMTAYLGYLEITFWPRHLTFLYLREPTVPLATLLLAASVLAGISALVVACVKTRPYLAAGWLWFLGMLLPVSGLVALPRLFIADRYTYLPSIGLAVMAVWGIAGVAGKFSARRPFQILAATGTAALLFLCAALTRHQLFYWQNTGTLMEHALKVDPKNYVAEINLRVYRFHQEHPGLLRKNLPPKSAN